MAAGPPLPSPHLEEVAHNQSSTFGSHSYALNPSSISFPKKIEKASSIVPLLAVQSPSPDSNDNNGTTNRNQPQSSTPTRYADVVKGKAHSFSFKEPAVPLMDLATINSTFQGKPAVLFPSLAKNMLVKRCNFVLIGKFSHGRPSLSSLNLFFVKLKIKGSINIINYDSKHIFLKCSCKEDFYRIWLGLVWFVEGLAMRVFKWFPEFSSLKESSVAPVWITVAGLPLHMFEESALMSIAKAAGNPIKVDPRNVNRSIVNMAWICVELDVQKPLVKDVWVSFVDENGKEQLDGFWIKISYEVLPSFCSFCQHIGHTPEFCKRKLEKEPSVVSNAILVGHKLHAASEYVKIMDAAGAIKLGVENEGAMLVGQGEGELGGKEKGLRQLKGMLANKLLQSESNATSSKTSVNPRGVKQIQRQNKVYQAKKQPLLSPVTLEITKNSFAILEEEVLIEDLSLEEGELDDAGVSTAAAIGAGNAVSPMNSVSAIDSVSAANVVDSAAMNTAAVVTPKVSSSHVKSAAAAVSSPESWGAAAISATTGTADTDSAATGHTSIQHPTSSHQEMDFAPGVQFSPTLDKPTAGERSGLMEAAGNKAGNTSAGVSKGEETAVLICNKGKQGAAPAEQEKTESWADQVENAVEEGVLLENTLAVMSQGAVEVTQRHRDGEGAAAESLVHTANSETVSECVEEEPAVLVVVQQEFQNQVEVKDLVVQPADSKVADLFGRPIDSNEEGVEASKATAGKIVADQVPRVVAKEHAVLVEEADCTQLGHLLVGRSKSEASITPQKLSSAAAEFTPKWAVLVEELVEGKKQSEPVLVQKEDQDSKALQTDILARIEGVQEKSANAGGQVVMVTNYAMDQLNERMRILRGDSLPAAPILATSTWVPPSMSKHLARELKIIRKHRSNQNWQDIEDYSDEESEEGELDERAGSQMLNGEAFLSDGMGDIPRPFKIKSAPNSPKGRNSSYDSSTYLLSRGFF